MLSHLFLNKLYSTKCPGQPRLLGHLFTRVMLTTWAVSSSPPTKTVLTLLSFRPVLLTPFNLYLPDVRSLQYSPLSLVTTDFFSPSTLLPTEYNLATPGFFFA